MKTMLETKHKGLICCETPSGIIIAQRQIVLPESKILLPELHGIEHSGVLAEEPIITVSAAMHDPYHILKGR